jgi:hypothetical protein
MLGMTNHAYPKINAYVHIGDKDYDDCDDDDYVFFERNDINNVAISIIWQNMGTETKLHASWR